MTPVRRARRVAVGGLALALFVTLFVDLAVLVVPIYDMQLYDRVLLSRNMDTVAMLSAACVVGLLLYGVLDYLRSAALVAIGEGVGRALGPAVLEAGIRHSLDGKAAAGGEALRDLNELRGFLASGAVSVPLDALCTPLFLAVLFMLHPAYGWIAVVGVAVLVMFGIVTDALVRPALVAAGALRASAANQLAAGLRARDLTEGLGMLPALTRRWAGQHGAALRRLHAAGNRSDNVAAGAKLARLSLQAGVMVLGAVLIMSNQASTGSLMGANLLLAKVLGPFDALTSSWRRWIAAGAAWQRIAALLAAPADAFVAEQARVPDERGLVLCGVGYAEPNSGRMLLQDVQLHLPGGTATALVGHNGAGKSTLLRLMVGLLPPSAGTIRLDGVPLAAVDRTGIGYLPQGVHLLDGTVLENVARFQDVPVDAAVAAAAAAGVHEMVGRLRQGYGTVVGQGALSLSGGQQQRVGLARALFGASLLLGLDEPDANLDQVGEIALLQAIDEARRAGAVVVVATHRPRLLVAMDLIVTVHEGRIERAAPPADAARPHLQSAAT